MDMRQTPYFKIFADVYSLLADNLPVKTDESYWEAVHKKADMLYRQYNKGDAPGNKYACRLILDTMDELGRICTQLEKGGKA